MNDFFALEEKLGITFSNKEVLRQAFTHRSYINEHAEIRSDHNERLEFLGDAVLELVTTRYLYEHYQNPEGVLTSWRAALVNSKMLSSIAEGLNFNDFLLLSKGETRDQGKARQQILANSIEAFIGALYLDKGYDVAAGFVHTYILKELPKIIEEKSYTDPKSRFQEIAQDKVGITPSYQVLEEWGPDHAKHFLVGAYLNEELVAKGEGDSKQSAQEQAAREALEAKGW